MEMNQQQVAKIAREEIGKYMGASMYKVNKVPFHTHNNLDSPPIQYGTIVNAPSTFTVTATTNGTTNVNVFGTGGAPYALTVVGAYLVSLDTTAGNITVLNGSSTVCTIAKGTTAGAMIGATSIANAVYRAGSIFQVDSSSAGNANVFIIFTI